ncbi:MAG: ATP-binding cassette domain-containing protein, partial [Clostridia bacterium]|nr:ATP-binding cassette domain-containing protein [Clostridia bacterium]
MLHIEHLTKTYGTKKAVDDLTVHLEPGQICAFIGHNGAGKTTTLKACCGIHDFDSGNILINGHSIKD